jgi:hypothetical protein
MLLQPTARGSENEEIQGFGLVRYRRYSVASLVARVRYDIRYRHSRKGLITMGTVQDWAHENIEGAENDEIETVWNDTTLEIYINGELVAEKKYYSKPDTDEWRLSVEIDAVNFFYAYG